VVPRLKQFKSLPTVTLPQQWDLSLLSLHAVHCSLIYSGVLVPLLETAGLHDLDRGLMHQTNT
jgi:hypothetical protein